MTRNPSTLQPGVASTWSIGLPSNGGTSVGQVPSAAESAAAAASEQRPRSPPSVPCPAKWSTVALKSPAMITFSRAHCAASQSRSLRQLRSSHLMGATACTATMRGPSPSTGSATTLGTVLVLPGGPGKSADVTAYAPRSGLISSVVDRALAMSS